MCSSLIAFLLIWGGTPLGVGGFLGGGGVGCGHPPCTCACTCACMHTHAREHTYACMLNLINMAASMVAAICNFPNMFILAFRVCACVHRACAHV